MGYIECAGDIAVQLEGTLDKFPLRELIEMVVYSSVTGVLELRVDKEIGQIFFGEGQPYHAVFGHHTGMEAICALFEQRNALFRFVSETESSASSLWLDPWELIERGEQQARLWVSVRPRIPTLDWVPALVASRGAGVHIDESVWPVLAAVDGQRSVGAIAERLNLMPIDTCVALISLLDQGMITIRHPRPAPLEPRPVPKGQEASSERSATPGFLERLLADAQSQDPPRPDLSDDELQERKRVNRYVGDF
jgi:hypothetical protein